MSTPGLELNRTDHRIAFIDALRGFTMFLVVFGHVMWAGCGINPYKTALGMALVSFRMPMFFFISGFIAFKALDVWTLRFTIKRLGHKAFVQLVPTAIFYTVFMVVMGRSLMRFPTHGLEGYWFTLVLFEMFVVYFLVALLSRRIGRSIVFDITMAVIAIGMYVDVEFFRVGGKVWTVLSLDNFFRYFQFFVLGLLTRKYWKGVYPVLRRNWVITVLMIGFVALLATEWRLYATGMEKHWTFMTVHRFLVRYFGMAMVFVLFVINEKVFQRDTRLNRVMQFVGRRTLDIYLLHYFFLPNLKGVAPLFAHNDNVVIEIALLTAITIGTVALCLGISALLRNSKVLAWWLFGSKPKKPVVKVTVAEDKEKEVEPISVEVSS